MKNNTSGGILESATDIVFLDWEDGQQLIKRWSPFRPRWNDGQRVSVAFLSDDMEVIAVVFAEITSNPIRVVIRGSAIKPRLSKDELIKLSAMLSKEAGDELLDYYSQAKYVSWFVPAMEETAVLRGALEDTGWSKYFHTIAGTDVEIEQFVYNPNGAEITLSDDVDKHNRKEGRVLNRAASMWSEDVSVL